MHIQMPFLGTVYMHRDTHSSYINFNPYDIHVSVLMSGCGTTYYIHNMLSPMENASVYNTPRKMYTHDNWYIILTKGYTLHALCVGIPLCHCRSKAFSLPLPIHSTFCASPSDPLSCLDGNRGREGEREGGTEGERGREGREGGRDEGNKGEREERGKSRS